MPHIVPSLELHQSKDVLWAMMQRIYQQLAKIFNGQISFGDGAHVDNISGFWVSFSNQVQANVPFSITHNLGRVPAGYLVMVKSNPCDVSFVTSTTTSITLVSNATVSFLRLFIF